MDGALAAVRTLQIIFGQSEQSGSAGTKDRPYKFPTRQSAMTLEGMSKNKYENVPAQQDNPGDDFETRYLIQLLREETILEKRRRASP